MVNAGCPLAAVGVRRMAPKDFKAKAKNARIAPRPAYHCRHGGMVNRHEPQAEPEPIRFLLAVVGDEQLRAFGAGILPRSANSRSPRRSK